MANLQPRARAQAVRLCRLILQPIAEEMHMQEMHMHAEERHMNVQIQLGESCAVLSWSTPLRWAEDALSWRHGAEVLLVKGEPRAQALRRRAQKRAQMARAR